MVKAQDVKDVEHFDYGDTLELYSESFNGLDDLNEVVLANKVFVTGENHTFTESNARLWLKMIKYLHKYAGVRNVMFEYGYSYGWLVNEYLQTGDTALYNSIKKFAYVEYSNVIKDLYEFNMSLDSSERIYLCAIDIERGVYPIAKLLNYLVPEEYEAHDSIKVHIQSISSLATYNDYKLREQDNNELSYTNFTYKSNPTLLLVQQNFMDYEEEYKQVLGDNFDLFKSVIVDKFNARKRWYKYEQQGAVQQYVYRENYMHDRFLIEAAEHPGAWFGQFGRCHTTKTQQNSNSCNWFMFNSLANRIENTKGDLYKDSVLTIGIIYNSDRSTGEDREEFEDDFDEYFDDIDPASIVLFDFSKDSVLASAYGEDFDYLFLNTHNKKGEAYESYLDIYDDIDFGVSVKILGEASIIDINFTNLNNVFADNGVTEEFGDPYFLATGFNIQFGAKENKRVPFYVGYSAGLYRGGTVSVNPNLDYAIKGFYIKENFHWNITPGLSFLDLLPGIAFGYEQVNLISTQVNNTSNDVLNGFIGSTKSTTYKNPALAVDLLFAADINISFISLGYQMGYSLDLSKTSWRTDGNLLSDSPATSLSGLITGVRAGFVF
ncbi:MAG: hypothetical protein JXR19_01330 [Bacteroidia bacterium]